ncbi:MAG: hypothetical protein A3B30_02045 [Candidatus Komeilibacteria bacterium RIFCSPLOWO2_01_FULL_52_15]|uniref:SIS domain-containing protein n=2 Tax=Candidatus Komeiliibacteriota TaxID=1817908 RepID=A0A1G2BV01_9BACT|nr:MAG: hypothetical protein A2677_00830 [Candidatus Komeilibacteria bacterium RIFCSPHIGHO2_01_FULL_52_14]OGY92100.1 MAG: hypothetical protein A3B30_02045 [Candidatus Komeilibacteria bacterium RIFCSPLOWO2_01_FULL_52_15]
MSSNLTLERLVKKYDRQRVGLSIASLSRQVEHSFKEFMRRTLPFGTRKFQNVIFCGMGGSALGADFIRTVYEPWLPVPIHMVSDYHLPAFANKNSLVILCSYSGTTEEILSCFKEARLRRLPSVTITAGGALARMARRAYTPLFQFTPTYNPSGQPRIGTGYLMASFYIALRKTILTKGGFEHLSNVVTKIKPQASTAYAFAQKVFGKSLVIIGADFLRANAHIFSNQLNESAKTFAPFFLLPELDHHLLEGMGSLRSARRHWAIVFLDSGAYEPSIKKRVRSTRHVFERQGFATHRISFSGTRVQQAFSALSFGGFASYYLALLQHRDPSLIPWVDFLKKRLAH